MSSDPYEASVSAALSSMNINSEATAQGKLLRGIENCLGAAHSLVQFVIRPWTTASVTIFLYLNTKKVAHSKKRS